MSSHTHSVVVPEDVAASGISKEGGWSENSTSALVCNTLVTPSVASVDDEAVALEVVIPDEVELVAAAVDGDAVIEKIELLSPVSSFTNTALPLVDDVVVVPTPLAETTAFFFFFLHFFSFFTAPADPAVTLFAVPAEPEDNFFCNEDLSANFLSVFLCNRRKR